MSADAFTESGPRPLWVLAHIAVQHGYDITIQPRGSSLTLLARRGETEVVARWKRGDRGYQGDGEGRWKPDGSASFTNAGDHAWIALAELREWLARPASERAQP